MRFSLCAGSQDSTTNSTILTRPLQTRKVLKPKQIMRNTSQSTLATEQQATAFTYLIQAHNAAVEDLDMQDLD